MMLAYLLVAPLIVTAADAKVLRSKGKSPTVLVFKDDEALSRSIRLVATPTLYSESVMESFLACKPPQGSKVEVLSSGRRTAVVRIVEGTANGCQGTVPIGNVRDK
jgi:hypothetical protein